MEIAADIYEALQGFFQRHSHLQARPLFITGESYAGKYVPSISKLAAVCMPFEAFCGSYCAGTHQSKHTEPVGMHASHCTGSCTRRWA